MGSPQPRPTIDIAREGDINEVIDLLKECGTYYPGEEQYLSKSTIVIAKYDGKIVGTRCFQRISPDYFHAYGLCVRADFRGKGVASELFDRSDDMMFAQGAKGYLGEAMNEKLAQYFVRRRGVRICWLSLRGWRSNLVPIKKDFRQEGAVDSILKSAHGFMIYWMRKRRLRWLFVILESISRRIKPTTTQY